MENNKFLCWQDWVDRFAHPQPSVHFIAPCKIDYIKANKITGESARVENSRENSFGNIWNRKLDIEFKITFLRTWNVFEKVILAWDTLR